MDGDAAGGSEGRKRKGKGKGRGKSSKKKQEPTIPPRVSDGEEEETESLVPINITDLTLEGEERVPVSSPSTDTPKSPTEEEVEEFEKEQKKKAEEKKKKKKKKKKKSSDNESSGSY